MHVYTLLATVSGSYHMENHAVAGKTGVQTSRSAFLCIVLLCLSTVMCPVDEHSRTIHRKVKREV